MGAQLKHLRTSVIICSFLWFALTLLIFFRITQSNHFPLANFYEALIFLTWCLVTLNFIILLEPTEKKGPVNSVLSQKDVLALLPFSKASVWSAPVRKNTDALSVPSMLGTDKALPNVSYQAKQGDETQMTFFQEEQSVQKQVSGAILAPCILFIIAFAQFHLSSEVTPLVPALKSNWLLMHVSIMICSYTRATRSFIK